MQPDTGYRGSRIRAVFNLFHTVPQLALPCTWFLVFLHIQNNRKGKWRTLCCPCGPHLFIQSPTSTLVVICPVSRKILSENSAGHQPTMSFMSSLGVWQPCSSWEDVWYKNDHSKWVISSLFDSFIFFEWLSFAVELSTHSPPPWK